MIASEVQLLKDIVTTVNGWAKAATDANCLLKQVNITMPDESMVMLSWDNDANEYQVYTQ